MPQIQKKQEYFALHSTSQIMNHLLLNKLDKKGEFISISNEKLVDTIT